MKLDRSLGKDGLHRLMQTNVTFKIDNEEERKACYLVFRETVSNNSYIYREELLQKGLEFLPNAPMDIEKPASVSKD